jgi:hypothetical protein
MKDRYLLLTVLLAGKFKIRVLADLMSGEGLILRDGSFYVSSWQKDKTVL